MKNSKNEEPKTEKKGYFYNEETEGKNDSVTSGIDETHDQVMDGYYSGTIDQVDKKSDEH